MKVRGVKYVSDYTIHVSFEDGLEGNIVLDELVDKGIFSILKNKALFSKVYTTGYSIAWSDDLEIDAANIYAEISGKKTTDFFNSSRPHASN